MKTTAMEHSSRRPSLLTLLSGALLAALLAAPSGCAEEGVTPTPEICVQDVDENGHIKDVDKGCNPFGLCVINGQARPAAECCADFPEGYEREACMYGYGAGPAPGQGDEGDGP
jgi:hypothetical protein